jgi:hypothetical protein
MTQPPHSAGGAGVPSTDFGAPTVSGTPRSSSDGGAAAAFLAASQRAAPGGAAPASATASAAAVKSPPQPRQSGGRGPRRARLQVRHINPWTVLKFSCVLSIALFFVWLIVIGVLFGVLDAAGVIGKINDTVTTINGPGSSDPVTAGVVFGGAAIIGVVNIVLFIALSTIGSVIYNLCADLVGGVELTLTER